VALTCASPEPLISTATRRATRRSAFDVAGAGDAEPGLVGLAVDLDVARAGDLHGEASELGVLHRQVAGAGDLESSFGAFSPTTCRSPLPCCCVAVSWVNSTSTGCRRAELN
jgi:hypothetical protein